MELCYVIFVYEVTIIIPFIIYRYVPKQQSIYRAVSKRISIPCLIKHPGFIMYSTLDNHRTLIKQKVFKLTEGKSFIPACQCGLR